MNARLAVAVGVAFGISVERGHAQSPDFAELNAASWGTFASDDAATSVENSTQHVKSGLGSVLFTTASGFDTGVRFPSSPNLNFDASAYNTLVFWEYPENTTPVGWQGEQPVVVVRTGTGTITLTPEVQQTPNFAWRLFKVPLAGGYGWIRSTTGTPNLADVDQVEIHHDTWDSGFRIWIDGLQFRSLDPASLPPAGPPPPLGVDANAIESKVYLYIFDPIMENFGGQRLHQVYGWDNPEGLTQQIISDFQASSHGRARFMLTETVVADEHPRFVDGFRHTDASFAAAWEARIFHESTFDYAGFIAQHNLGARVDAGEFDEVWVYAPPIGGMWESAMAGQGAYWINGSAYPDAGGQRAFVVMGWNYERGVGEAIHSFGHRAESILVHSYGTWTPDRSNTWSRFALLDRDAPGLGGVGNVHFPVNGESDYDYANPRFVASNADAWLNYPNLNDTTRLLNRAEWSPAEVDSQREYLNWWYRHMPHVGGRAPDGYLSNWWRYVLDVDQFKSWNGNLAMTIGVPTVSISGPANGAHVHGTVLVRAAAEVDGALGRVDLYVDDRYVASDYLAPYTFTWDSHGRSGSHELVAKAYELQNGTESESASTTVVIDCPTDLNDDGTATPADVAMFVARWLGSLSQGSLDADFTGDLAIEPSDVAAFVAAWYAATGGGC